MTRDDTEIVSAVRNAIADKVGRERFTLWFGSIESVRLDGNALVIGAPDQFSLERLRKRFTQEIREACQGLLPQPFDLQFRVVRLESIADSGREDIAGPTKAIVQPPTRRTGNSTHRKPQRIGSTRRYVSLDSFVVGDENRVAQTAAENAIRRPGSMTPLFIHGPTGCGKTHLLEAIFGETRRAAPRRRCILLSAEQFTTYFLQALRGGGLPSFRRRYRDLDLLLIDDVQFFAGKRATLVELQHTIDTLLRENRQLVLSADRPAFELLQFGHELVARLAGGLVCAIQSPRADTRVKIARQICASRGYQFSTEILELVASRVGSDVRQLSGAVNHLQATSEALKEPMTAQLAAVVLRDLATPERALVRIADVERAVCDLFGLEPRQLQSSGRSTSISHPRMLAMWLARKYTRAAFSEIGDYFGRRSHSTVISAQKKVTGWVESGKQIRLPHASCNVQDAIRRVEDRLHSA